MKSEELTEDQEQSSETTGGRDRTVFINCVDSFHGSNIARYLSGRLVGSSRSVAVSEETSEEETEEPHGPVSTEPSVYQPKYQIIGTMHKPKTQTPEFVKQVIKFDQPDKHFEHLIKCEVIIYDITKFTDQIEEVNSFLARLQQMDLEKSDKMRTTLFILLSTILTWAKIDQRQHQHADEDGGAGLTEADYRRRRPHREYKEHVAVEKLIVKLGHMTRGRLQGYVVAAGLTYGAEEDIFHHLFKAGYDNAQELAYFDKGQNILPTIHIVDLAAVILNIADSPPATKYILAVDESKNTLKDIVKAISKALTTGKVVRISQELALMNREISQHALDHLLVDLRLDRLIVKDGMTITWVSLAGMIENMDAVLKEYFVSRCLQPLRIMILGPPGVGKSTVAKQLCENYSLCHIHLKDVIDGEIEKMKKFIEGRNKPKEEWNLKEVSSVAMVGVLGEVGEEMVVEEEEEETEGKTDEDEEATATKAAEYEALLQTISDSMQAAGNGGRISDAIVTRFVRQRLLSKPCQNRGFVLDGYPKTMQQAMDLFKAEDESGGGGGGGEEEEEDATRSTSFNALIMPEYIIMLRAEEDFIRERIMNLPESVVFGTHNTEHRFTQRYSDYQKANEDDVTVLNYFDQFEINLKNIDVTNDDSLKMADTVCSISFILGPQRNYGSTSEEKTEKVRQDVEAQLQRKIQENLRREWEEQQEKECSKRRKYEWMKHREMVQCEEQELLELQSVPLRNYLMIHVMPTLSQALLACCSQRPDDPIDFLAEYLFRTNPQVD